MNIRESIIDTIRILSLASEQLTYEKSLTHAGHAPSELIEMYCSDLYNPKSEDFISSFSNDELKELAHLYGLISEVPKDDFPTVTDMLKNPKWRRVIELAKKIYSFYEVNK